MLVSLHASMLIAGPKTYSASFFASLLRPFAMPSKACSVALAGAGAYAAATAFLAPAAPQVNQE